MPGHELVVAQSERFALGRLARRLYMGVLLASLMVGAGLLPNIEPRPVVKQMSWAPLAIWPVAATGS
jgi:hypothetical protein